jgi:hypothetical protein
MGKLVVVRRNRRPRPPAIGSSSIIEPVVEPRAKQIEALSSLVRKKVARRGRLSTMTLMTPCIRLWRRPHAIPVQ